MALLKGEEYVKTAIVSGASGFVGCHLVRELCAMGVEVTAFCRRGSQNLERLPNGINIAYSIDELPRADVFYHLAWDQASGPGRGNAVIQSQNATMTLELLHAAHTLGARFVVLGTVYERFAENIMQSSKFSGLDFYILAKHFAHTMSKQLAFKLGIELVWCQICHPIGQYIKPEQLMSYTVSGLLRGDAPSYGPAISLYDILAVEDVAWGLYLIGNCKNTRDNYYIGSGKPLPLREYLENTRRILRVETPVLINRRPDDGLRFERDWFDITALQKDTDYNPTISFERAVWNVADWVGEQ